MRKRCVNFEQQNKSEHLLPQQRFKYEFEKYREKSLMSKHEKKPKMTPAEKRAEEKARILAKQKLLEDQQILLIKLSLKQKEILRCLSDLDSLGNKVFVSVRKLSNIAIATGAEVTHNKTTLKISWGGEVYYMEDADIILNSEAESSSGNCSFKKGSASFSMHINRNARNGIFNFYAKQFMEAFVRRFGVAVECLGITNYKHFLGSATKRRFRSRHKLQ